MVALENSVILLIGAPLSGKGTQGKLLSQSLNCQYVSSGDLFRQEIQNGSQLGQEMKFHMDKGDLIPNELTTRFLTNKLTEQIYCSGLILDGYPRNLSHLTILENILFSVNRKIVFVIYLNVLKEELNERRLSRKRNDDDEQVFEHRYEIFQKETLPLVELFQTRKLLIEIKSNYKSIEIIQEEIRNEINRFEEKLNCLNACQWLKHKLINSNNLSDLFNEFRRRALNENEKQGRRTGIVRRIIYLTTENHHKFQEHKNIFEKLYGIELIQLPSNFLDQSNIFLLLNETVDNVVQLALISETSNVYRPDTDQLSSLHHGETAMNRSKLKSFLIDKQTKELIYKEYEYSTMGTIDLSRRSSIYIDKTIFDWDDIFVVQSNGFSYQQLKQLGIKNSSRDMVISFFIKDTIHYKQLINLKFDPPPKAKRSIDFSLDVYDYVSSNKSYTNSKVIQYGFYNLILHVLNSGIFFRSATNRRQSNYWSPGLNGGLPLTRKDDQIHQDTFMAHDIGHFAIPDLIFIGKNSIEHRRVYIAYRMISEATTMVLADMLFVDGLAKSNIQYDFNKRKIYSLFKDLNFDLENEETRIENLKRLIKANYEYCLCGNDSLYVDMLDQRAESQSLKEFKEKFSPFFVEDYRWTEHNYENLVERSEEMSLWWNQMHKFRNLQHTESIESIDEFIQQIQSTDPDVLHGPQSQLLDVIFNIVFKNKIQRILNPSTPPLLDQTQRLYKSFVKWIIGQLAITSKFDFLSQSNEVREQIYIHLNKLSSNGRMTMDDVNQIRLIYENYLKFLLEKSFISNDDFVTFKEVYPLFDPFYVNYDKHSSTYEDLSVISQRIYSIDHFREKQLNKVKQILDRSLTTNESFYLKSMYTLIESGDGQIFNGLFVTRPGLLILSESPIDHPDGYVTFLISGITIETSLELISHHEAKVARLTSSKTNAMNIPLFCLQGSNKSQQRIFIENLLRYHSYYESVSKPRDNWGEHANEFYNQTFPANKVTAICYTMKLIDFHKLFIGRIQQQGNEQEVIHIVQRMIKLLHSKYPQWIQPIEFYLNVKNDAKYISNSNANPFQLTQSVDSIQLLAKTKLTREADRLLKQLNIDCGDDCLRLAQFRSRLTYLAFSKISSNEIQQKTYLDKIIHQHGHLSILDASQAIFILPTSFHKSQFDSLFTCQQTSFGLILFTNLKQIHQSLLRVNSDDKQILHTMINLIQLQSNS